MIDISKIDYSNLDRPEILEYLFHPRTEWAPWGSATRGQELFVPVEDDIVVNGRFHMADPSAANILFFHGNGEIVSDYDEMGPLYNQLGINFLPVDYRGYGRSTGTPTITAMMRDGHVIFDFIGNWLKTNSCSGRFILMGRSLGSASVLELAASYPNLIDGLIIESGFAYAGPLLQLLGINLDDLGFTEEIGFRNLDKIRKFTGPTLIIHAEYDHIIPFSDGQALYDTSQSNEKMFLKIPQANHNNIFQYGASQYLSAVEQLVAKTI